MAQGLDQTIVIHDTHLPGSLALDSNLPRVDFCVPVSFTLRCHAFLGFHTLDLPYSSSYSLTVEMASPNPSQEGVEGRATHLFHG